MCVVVHISCCPRLGADTLMVCGCFFFFFQACRISKMGCCIKNRLFSKFQLLINIRDFELGLLLVFFTFFLNVYFTDIYCIFNEVCSSIVILEHLNKRIDVCLEFIIFVVVCFFLCV